MLDFDIQGDLKGLIGWTEQLRGWLPDMQGLAYIVSDALIAENHRARAAGEDGQGNPLPPVAQSTIERRRRAGYADPSAAPFVPGGDASRINDLSVTTVVAPGQLTVTATWAATPWLKYHVNGGGYLPKRDVRGLTPEFQAFLSDVLGEYVRLRLQEALSGGTLAAPTEFLPDHIRG